MIAYHVVTDRPMHPGQRLQFDGSHCCGVYRRSNRRLAEQYWENPYDGSGVCEMLVDGEIEVVEIVKEINANLPEDAE